MGCPKSTSTGLEGLKKINVFRRINKKNQNKNFVKKINHEYFGGSDVTNVNINCEGLLNFGKMYSKKES